MGHPAASVRGGFHLVDHDGNPVTHESYLGRYMLIFFGFTHCRMVCPEALGKLSRALNRLGDLAECVQPLYITVDPDRDSPEVMRDFLTAHYPRFTGLTGTRAEIARAAQAYHVYYRREDDDEDPDGYAMPHSALTFLIGPDGVYRTHFPDVVTEDEVVRGLRRAIGADATG